MCNFCLDQELISYRYSSSTCYYYSCWATCSKMAQGSHFISAWDEIWQVCSLSKCTLTDIWVWFLVWYHNFINTVMTSLHVEKYCHVVSAHSVCRMLMQHHLPIPGLYVVDMLHHWHSAVDSGQSVRIVFIDFAKAFDRVDHNVLMTRMMALNLPEIIIRWM